MITLGNHALRSYMTWLLVTLTWLPVTLTWLLYNLQVWRYGRWFRKFTVRFRPIRKELESSMYNNFCNSRPINFSETFKDGRMVSALDSGASGPGSIEPWPARDIVLCSWARRFTLTVPLFTQVYKWVPVNSWGNLTNYGEVTCEGLTSRLGEVEMLLAASCYRNQDKLRQLWASLGSKASPITCI